VTAAPLRLGVIGLGSAFERFHLPALERVAEIEIVALADADPERCRRIAANLGAVRCHADASSLIASELDAVAVCVPPADHAAVSLEVLRAGRHLFLEKPIALSIEEANRLVEASRRAPVVAMTGFNLRGHLLAQDARRRVQSGRLGLVRSVHTIFTQTAAKPRATHWRGRPGQGGEALLDLGVHHFDLLRFVLGSEIEELSAETSPDGTSARVQARLSGGVDARIDLAGSLGPADANAMEIEAEEAHLSVSFYRAFGLRQRPGGIRRLARLAPALAFDRFRGGAFPSSYRRQWRSFARAVANGNRGDPTLEDGRASLAAAIAALEAARSRRPVPVARPIAAVTEVPSR